MAKADIHPKTKPYTIKFPDGSDFETVSAANSSSIIVETHYKDHPAWTGNLSARANQNATQVAKFNKKFAALSAMLDK